jgi:hypothetical protein
MSVKVISNTVRITTDTALGANLALRFMVDDIDRTARPKTPKKDGFLRDGVFKTVQGLKGKIVWNKEYAAAQESTQFVNYTTPGTGPHYAENAVKEILKNPDKYFRKAKLI